ncbi:MAG: hypothetical protein LHW64_07025 [Candidatus Cloacimonetes bacterium]|jgi:hypothetical protein|nr:hypothetical protein [Candidatus Cloacimonadota bacterium]MCK9584944.1 hypothetical protein [Candidatus Cloacimonadota bacterium]MDY0229860.1 hypothetical protein [Candidatus Cloacimonadaceae bacterium]
MKTGKQWLDATMFMFFLMISCALSAVSYVSINANLQGSGPVAWGDYDFGYYQITISL